MMRDQILMGCVLVMVSAGVSAAGPGTGTSPQRTTTPVLLPPPTAKSVEIKKLTDALAKAKAALSANKEKMDQLNQTIRDLEGKLRAQDDAMERLRQKITEEVEATLRGQMAVLQKEIEQKSKVASIEPVTAPAASKEVDTPDACPAEWEPSFLVVREYIHTRRPQLEKQNREYL